MNAYISQSFELTGSADAQVRVFTLRRTLRIVGNDIELLHEEQEIERSDNMEQEIESAVAEMDRWFNKYARLNGITISEVFARENESSVLLYAESVFNKNSDIVTVYKPRKMYGQMSDAQINWGGVGSQSQSPSVMIEALNVAVGIAKRLNNNKDEASNE